MVYFARYAEAVRVRHAVRKKSRQGIGIPREDLRTTSNGAEERNRFTPNIQPIRQMPEMPRNRKEIPVIVGSGNIYEDLGFEDPELEQQTSNLVRMIAGVIGHRAAPTPRRSWSHQRADSLGAD